jgi:hypothetical protein
MGNMSRKFDRRDYHGCYYRPGPPLLPCLVVLLLLAASGTFFGISISYGGKVSFASKVLLMIVSLVSIPSVVNRFARDFGGLAVATIEALSATAVVALFSIWLVGLSSLGIWVGVLCLLLLLLLVGAYLLRWIQDKVIKRLSSSERFPLSLNEVSRLKESAKLQVVLYGSLPLGLVLATGYGWVVGLSEVEILALSISVILVVASLILAVLLIASAIIMAKPLILLDPDAIEPSVSKGAGDTFLGAIARFFRIRLPSQPADEQDNSQYLDMAYLAGDLRKVYFYDSVHTVTLLTGFVLSVISIFDIRLVLSNPVWFGLAGLLALFSFCYLPYSVGQYHLHETIVGGLGLEGLQRKELRKALMEASPLYPQSDFIGALVASGTVGGLIAALVYEVAKGALK